MIAKIALDPGWHDYIGECFLYFAPMSVLHLIVFVIGCLVLAVSSRKKTGLFRRRIGHFGLFLLLFLFVSSLVNGLWSCLIYGHLYSSSDYVFDFMPFLPVSRCAERLQVTAYGTTLTELNAV
jgi:hypothetical protein